jgi:hypothetical protein
VFDQVVIGADGFEGTVAAKIEIAVELFENPFKVLS